jgi:hypothetical protein
MDPFTWRTISHIAVFVGSGLALFGGVGTWYFGNQVEKIIPYRQPINVASATVELIIASDEQINTHYMDRGGYLIFAKGPERLLQVYSQDSWAKQLGEGRVFYKGIFNMDANDPSAGKPVNHLAKAEYVQIFFHKIPKGKKVLSGKAVCTINNDIRFEIDIPEQMPKQIAEDEAGQRLDTNLIFAKDLKSAFVNFERQ